MTFKGTVAREKLLNWGLGEMDWTLTIDRTWFLHFPDHLFKCYNILTVCRLEVKPVWWLSATDALRWLIEHAVVALSCLIVCGLQQFSGQQCTLLQCTAEANSTCKQAVCWAKKASYVLLKVYKQHAHFCCCSQQPVAVCTLLVCGSCSQHSSSVLLLQSAQYQSADCNDRTLIITWVSWFLL